MTEKKTLVPVSTPDSGVHEKQVADGAAKASALEIQRANAEAYFHEIQPGEQRGFFGSMADTAKNLWQDYRKDQKDKKNEHNR